MCICGRSNPQWFEAAANNNTQYIKDHLDEFKRTYDNRDTNIEAKVFKGFSAIHYAAFYGNIDCLQLLMPVELEQLNKQIISVKCPGFSEKVKFKIYNGNNCLCIALL